LEFKRLLTAPDQAAADRLAEIGKSSAEIPTRMIAILDGERFKRSGGHWSGVTLDRACKLSESVSWKDTGDYRSALLVLARELAPVSTARARRVMDTYGSIPTALSPTLLANFNSRRRSQEAFVWGLVYRAEGQKEQAVAKLKEAFEAYDAVGYRWRATLAAVELAELTGSQYFGNFAMKEADARPNSWLARRVHLSRIRVARGG